jgi:hypothetical protein
MFWDMFGWLFNEVINRQVLKNLIINKLWIGKILEEYPGLVGTEGLKKQKKKKTQDSRCPIRDINWALPK